MIVATKFHINDDPDLPEIPDFDDFCNIFKSPKDFGKKTRKNLSDNVDWRNSNFDPRWADLVEDGVECWYFGANDFLDDESCWAMCVGKNGMYGLCFYIPSENYMNELGVGDSFQNCLVDCKDYIEDFQRETAYYEHER